MKTFLMMKTTTKYASLLLLAVVLSTLTAQAQEGTIYQFTMNSITGEAVPLSDYKGKVVIIVNTASECGLTPQYEDLQRFYEEYQDNGVVILGFPANNFMNQEPGDNEQIKKFCESRYGVTFPMFEKISVKGKNQHPLYTFLTDEEANGTVGEKVKWNFQKFVIDRNGKVRGYITPKTSIYSDEAVALVQKLMNE